MPDEKRRDFFISYTKADESWATWIAQALEAADYTFIIQAWDFVPGTNFVHSMEDAVQRCDRVLPVLTPAYRRSGYASAEWYAFFGADPTGTDRRIVPVRVLPDGDEKQLSLLQQVVYIDLVGAENEIASRERLISGLRAALLGASDRPHTPFPGAGLPLVATPASEQEIAPFPRDLPTIWLNVGPYLKHFVGREALIERVGETLRGENALAITAMHGLGGIGKTELARAYCWTRKDDYDLVAWLRAEEPTSLTEDVIELGRAAGLIDGEVSDAPEAARLVVRWLTGKSRWLLVYDNATDRHSLAGFLPSGGGHVLITSRHPDWAGLATKLDVPTLEPDDSVKLLLQRSGDVDEGAARELAQALAYLPLALEHAAAYVEVHGVTLRHYFGLYTEQKVRLLARGSGGAEDTVTVATTWELIFQQLRGSLASELLMLLSFLAPEKISLHMLRSMVEQAGNSSSPTQGEGAGDAEPQVNKLQPLAGAFADGMRLDETIGALQAHSLVHRAGDDLSVHRLVQEVTRSRLCDEGLGAWQRQVVDGLLAVLPRAEGDSHRACAPMIPHAQALLECLESSNVEPFENVALIQDRLARYFEIVADFESSKGHYERALAIDEASYGLEHPQVAADLNNLGLVLRALGDMAGAKTQLERALAITEAALGSAHPSVASCLNNLGSVLKVLGDLAGAKANYERALAIHEAAYGPEHQEVATDLNNLGTVLEALGDLAGAKTQLERALVITEVALGSEHPSVATSLNNLGSVLQEFGDLAAAMMYYARALAIDEAAFGLAHPRVATRLNNLGVVLAALGDLTGAKSRLERAVAIIEAALGPEHPETAALRGNLEVLEEGG